VGTELIALVKVGGKGAYAAARPRTFAGTHYNQTS
jgi:hypothetical protein